MRLAVSSLSLSTFCFTAGFCELSLLVLSGSGSLLALYCLLALYWLFLALSLSLSLSHVASRPTLSAGFLLPFGYLHVSSFALRLARCWLTLLWLTAGSVCSLAARSLLASAQQSSLHLRRLVLYLNACQLSFSARCWIVAGSLLDRC